jgi:ankyrin repeat protein
VKKVEGLLHQGLDVDARDEKGDTPLAAAVWAGNRDVAMRLILRGANPDAPGNLGFRPLHSAVVGRRNEIGKAECLALLLAAGASVDWPIVAELEADKATALRIAVLSGFSGGVAVLLAGGASPDPRSNPAKSLLQISHETVLGTNEGSVSRQEEQPKIEALLVAAGAKVPPDMQDYVQQPEFVARLAAARDAIAAAKKEIEAARERLAKAGYGGPGAKKPPAAKTTKTISAAQYLTLGLGATMIVGLLVLGYSLGRARRRRLLSSAENMSNEEK